MGSLRTNTDIEGNPSALYISPLRPLSTINQLAIVSASACPTPQKKNSTEVSSQPSPPPPHAVHTKSPPGKFHPLAPPRLFAAFVDRPRGRGRQAYLHDKIRQEFDDRFHKVK
jgi:hypothetical protein